MNLFERFRAGLTRTRAVTAGRISSLLGLKKLDETLLTGLEELLIEADIGVTAADEIIGGLRSHLKADASLSIAPRDLLRAGLIEQLNHRVASPLPRFASMPWVMLLVGVNGTGKTTTAGKLAHYFSLAGKKSVIAAADTFRAAGVEQVEAWAERSGSRLVKQAQGADPAAVTFDAYQSARARGEDLLIVDTAGRLQSKRNLMEELAKISRTLKKLDPTAPHETLLVIDATTGQNGLSQAKSFLSASGLTGIVVTKLDGTARGGIAIAIHRELGLPIEFVGMGEAIDDLQPFNADAYVGAILEG